MDASRVGESCRVDVDTQPGFRNDVVLMNMISPASGREDDVPQVPLLCGHFMHSGGSKPIHAI